MIAPRTRREPIRDRALASDWAGQSPQFEWDDYENRNELSDLASPAP